MGEIQALRDQFPHTYVIRRIWTKGAKWHGGSLSVGYAQYLGEYGVGTSNYQEAVFVDGGITKSTRRFASKRSAEKYLKWLLERDKWVSKDGLVYEITQISANKTVD